MILKTKARRSGMCPSCGKRVRRTNTFEVKVEDHETVEDAQKRLEREKASWGPGSFQHVGGPCWERAAASREGRW